MDSRLPNSQILASQCLIRNFDLSSGCGWRLVLQVLAAAIPFLLQVINNHKTERPIIELTPNTG